MQQLNFELNREWQLAISTKPQEVDKATYIHGGLLADVYRACV
jgi:hypothetical protein